MIQFFSQLLQGLHYDNVFILAGELLLIGGWLFVFKQLWPEVKETWLNWRQMLFGDQNPNVLMEVILPKDHNREIEAAEHFLNQIHALRRTQTKWEIWWKGQFTLKISFEIVSFEGKIRFFVRSSYKHMHLVQDALHAQYGEAEIKVLKDEDDFIHAFPNKMPHPEFEMLGSEYVLAKPDYYPLKTYKEHKAPDGRHLNPLRHLLETMSNLKEGEYMWYQLVAVPESEVWGLNYKGKVDELLGIRAPKKKKPRSLFALFLDELLCIVKYILLLPLSLLYEFYRQLVHGTPKVIKDQGKNVIREPVYQLRGMGREAGAQIYCLHDAFMDQFRKKKSKKNAPHMPVYPSITLHNHLNVAPEINVNAPGVKFPSDYVFLSEKRKKIIDAIERKLSQQVFKTCVRVLYFGKKPVYSKFRFWSEVHGFFRHFNDVDYNVWMRGEYSKTSADYFFARLRKRFRQKAIIANAKARDWYAGDKWIYLSAEELASLWHLPKGEDLISNVKTVDGHISPPPYMLRQEKGYKKERLGDFDHKGAPENLPVTEFEPYNYA